MRGPPPPPPPPPPSQQQHGQQQQEAPSAAAAPAAAMPTPSGDSNAPRRRASSSSTSPPPEEEGHGHHSPSTRRVVVVAPSLPRTVTAAAGEQQQQHQASTAGAAAAADASWQALAWTAAKRFMAGAVGGVAEVVVGHPADTLKTRLQTIAVTAPAAASSTGAGVAGAAAAAAAAAAAVSGGGQASALKLLTATIRNEGFLALYRGASSRLVGSAIGNSVLFGTNGEFKRLLDADSARPLSGAFLLAAGFTGLAEAMVFTPIDLCKVRCQVQYGREAALSPWGVAKQLVREHGVMRGLYTGAGPTMLRDFVGNAFYFACYELAKRALLARGAAREWGETPVFVLSGGIAGCAYWAAILPIDTVKSIVQSQEGPAPRAVGVAAGLWKSGGVPAFYRGLGPALVRAFPTSAATFAAYETTIKFLDRL